ncbi:hypothetical protein [Streptomyces sp. NBC_01363]|uniref:hypothetical protein n=1 Tax=Streptomyces sp. NBC_01363 TaxID=2903840 RepID=UPI00224D91C6|nr:hypothetical protein [Streptomyces sp. NBC_01363]MCX4734298.1 hypothetical protein [Streptomyces sp. NBC_01363]
MTSLTTGAERLLAVEHWFLSTVADRRRVRVEWEERLVALLPCGPLFAAVRIPSFVVQAAAGSDQQDAVDRYLAEALAGGPVICDRHADQYYALVPVGTVRRWHVPGTVCLGSGQELGVPRPGLGGADGTRVYWSVPMDSAGELCSPAAVAQAVMVGRLRSMAHG